jgi:indolepyruvate ferredoxin oxidoreductase beta subunit
VLLARLERHLPEPAQALVLEGLRRLVDYQDTAYATLYLARLERVFAALQASQVSPGPLLGECARHLALWMSYEDTARVADLKTRRQRFSRVRQDARVGREQTLEIHEYFHPRLQEVCETLPAWAGLGQRETIVVVTLHHASTRRLARTNLQGSGILVGDHRQDFASRSPGL